MSHYICIAMVGGGGLFSKYRRKKRGHLLFSNFKLEICITYQMFLPTKFHFINCFLVMRGCDPPLNPTMYICVYYITLHIRNLNPKKLGVQIKGIGIRKLQIKMFVYLSYKSLQSHQILKFHSDERYSSPPTSTNE